MLTIVETPLFKSLVSDYWTEDERGEFCSWLANGEIWLLTIYAKSARENIPGHTLKAIKEAIENA